MIYGKCPLCNRLKNLHYWKDVGLSVCDDCGNRKAGAMAEDEVFHAAIPRTELAKLVNERGEVGLDRFIEDLRDAVCPDNVVAIEKHPMHIYGQNSAHCVEFIQKVDI